MQLQPYQSKLIPKRLCATNVWPVSSVFVLPILTSPPPSLSSPLCVSLSGSVPSKWVTPNTDTRWRREGNGGVWSGLSWSRNHVHTHIYAYTCMFQSLNRIIWRRWTTVSIGVVARLVSRERKVACCQHPAQFPFPNLMCQSSLHGHAY